MTEAAPFASKKVGVDNWVLIDIKVVGVVEPVCEAGPKKDETEDIDGMEDEVLVAVTVGDSERKEEEGLEVTVQVAVNAGTLKGMH